MVTWTYMVCNSEDFGVVDASKPSVFICDASDRGDIGDRTNDWSLTLA